MLQSFEALFLAATTLYQTIAIWREAQQSPPGKRIDVGGYFLHLWVEGKGHPTIVLDHSLGGIEGYLLIQELSKLTRVCIYDRAGYGWSDHSPHPRTSQQIVQELDRLLTQANIEPPYILIGDSFGSYNVRLYAHTFPEKVAGLVLTDGLHETGMLKMSLSLRALQLFFVSGFVMSVLGAILGIIRSLKTFGVFEMLKPDLRQFSQAMLNPIKRSFCRPKHWLTMSRELLSLKISSAQVQCANQFGDLPIVSIKSKTFFKPSLWTKVIPLQAANRLRDQMHPEWLKLSTDCIQMKASQSGHFVWVDQPDVIVAAVKLILEKLERDRA
jgi:pimeloyl-ACP methyl ester carboxylesterase